MGAVGAMVLVTFVLTVVSVAWRTHLELNHPEKAERLRQYQERQKEAHRETYRKAVPVIGVGVKLLVKMLTKK
jgi:hypothetical protein